MIVRKFLSWSATATAAERAPAAAALARALLDGELPYEEEGEAEIALAALVDDPSPLVRSALAGQLARRADAPRHVLVALLADQPEIAVPILRLSPALRDADLIDAAIVGDPMAQTAIALRETVSAPVCAALVEIGDRAAIVALLGNPGAVFRGAALERIVERFGSHASAREALLARDDLAPTLRARLVDAAATLLQDFVVSCGWMSSERAERATREAREKGFVIVAAEAAEAGACAELAACLRGSGRLTAALLLRSVLSGEHRLLEASLAELAGVTRERAAGCLVNFNGQAFGALYCRADLPEVLLPVFRFALQALTRGPAQDEFADGGLQRGLVEQVIADCEQANLPEAQPVLGLLRRFQAEAARHEAREFSAWLARAEALGSLAPEEDGDAGETADEALEGNDAGVWAEAYDAVCENTYVHRLEPVDVYATDVFSGERAAA